jgi:hypothetical protein
MEAGAEAGAEAVAEQGGVHVFTKQEGWDVLATSRTTPPQR